MSKNKALCWMLFVMIPFAFLALGDALTESTDGGGYIRLKMQRRMEFEDKIEALQKAVAMDTERMRRRLSTGRRRSLLAENFNVLSGSSVGSGEYLVSVSIGSPPQKVFLIADTGSDLTWVKCSRGQPGSGLDLGFPAYCDRTSHPCSPSATNFSFIPSKSSSFKPLSCSSTQCAAWFFPPTCDRQLHHCKFTHSYADSSYATGSVAYETVTLGTGLEMGVLLGCGHVYSGPNFDKAGGVMGLGPGPMSFASQLGDQGSASSSASSSGSTPSSSSTSLTNKFSYCLTDFLGPSSIIGSLALGESASQTVAPLQYTPLVVNSIFDAHYYVGVQEVRVAGATLEIPGDVWQIDAHGYGGVILDSGTTLAQFLKPAYDPIRHAFQHAISYPQLPSIAGLDLCYNVSLQNSHFPEFAIVFQGNLLFQPPQENSFSEPTTGITCLAMQSVPSPGFSVIGNLLQQNYNIEIDRLHNQLGIAPADCSKLH